MGKVAPELRFPGFNAAWKKTTIENIALVSSGGTPSRVKPENWGGNIPWVTTSEVGQRVITKSTEKITSEGLKSSSAKLFDAGTILMAMYGQGKTRGQVSMLGIKASTNQACAAIMLSDGHNPEFYYYYLFRQYEDIRNIANDGAQKNLSGGIVKQLSVPLIDEDEQRKISGFLSSIDEKLTKLRRKRELLETYKRGTMQKIFSQELRFKKKGGGNYPNWKQLRLNEFLYEHKKRNYDLEFSKEDVLSVSGDMGVVNQIEHLGRSYAGKSVANYHVVHHGDIVYTKSPLKNNPYGIIKSNKGKAGIVSTLYAVYSCKDNAYSEYLDYYFSIDDNVNRYLRPLVHKGAKNDMKINNQRVLIDSISIPSYEEQKKIVEFLTSLDRKIDEVSKKIEQTESFKRGLLQKMFI